MIRPATLTPQLALRWALPVTLATLAAACTPWLPAGTPGADGAAAGAAAEENCTPWTVEPIATNLGMVENMVFDGRGGLLLSMLEDGELRRLTPDGTVTTMVDSLEAPGGLARRGPWVYVTTGLTVESATEGIPDGTIERINVLTGRQETWATGLVSPNGLALLRDGSAVATRTLSGGDVLSEVTRVPARDRDQLELFWSDLTGTNGVVADPSGRWVYVSRSLSQRAEIWRIPTKGPSAAGVGGRPRRRRH